MERPKRIANITIGTNTMIGTVSGRPINALPHPHWKIATSAPNDAPIDSRFITTALNGTNSDRNTIISNTNVPASTAPMQGAVRAGAEAPVQQVIGEALGLAGRGVAVVDHPEAHAAAGGGECQEHD